jgi:hypothetical protein
VALLTACNNEATVSSSADSSTTTATTMESQVSLPYQVERTPDWEMASNENTAIAMAALKSFETNDSSKIRSLVADSIEFYYDNGKFKGSRDSFVTMLTNYRNGYDNVSIKMLDYESVKSKNRNEEWVSLWYTETYKDKKGKVDSFMTMDDIRIENGKIKEIDTKARKLAAK